MNVLAFDTSSEIFSVALQTGNNSYSFSCTKGYKHSETLIMEIESLFEKSNSSLADVDLIVCPKGPGSFTGLRIGISTAKGLSFGSGIPMVTIPTLDMMAYGFDYFDGTVIPVIDARKKRFYTAFYESGKKISDDLDLTFEDISNKLNKHRRLLITGPDALLFSGNFDTNSLYRIDLALKGNWAENLIPLGVEQFKNNGPSHDTEGPLYLRKSEAEIGIKLKS